jgi:hypothetical protein
VRILFTNQALDHPGGAESYLVTVIDELLHLGHDVVAWSERRGAVADRLERIGCHVYDRLEDAAAVDVIHAQHAPNALAARVRFPDTPLVFVCHSRAMDIEDPPAAAVPAALVAFNDLVARRLRATSIAEHVPVHRLRQPVAMTAMEGARVPIGGDPPIGVAINRDLTSRLEVLEAACEAAGIELETPTRDGMVDDPTPAMMRADIVFAVGRTAVEAMAQARAAFVYDQTGSGGFVTADSYEALESSGFTPIPGEALTVDSLAKELRRYDPAFGQLGRELVGRYHAARVHAAELVELYRSVVSAAPVVAGPHDAIAELALLERRFFDFEVRLRDAQWARAFAERRTKFLQRELDRIWRSASWRITRPLRWFRRLVPRRHPVDEGDVADADRSSPVAREDS